MLPQPVHLEHYCRHKSLLYRLILADLLPIQNINEPLLGYLRQALYLLPVDRNVNQVRCGWQIIIPNFMVCGLKIPDHFRLKRRDNNTSCKEIITKPMSTIIIVTAYRKAIDITQLWIRPSRSKRCSSGYSPTILFPSFCPILLPEG